MGALDDLGVCCLTVVGLQADPHPRGRRAIRRRPALLSVMRDGLLRRGEAAGAPLGRPDHRRRRFGRLTISE